MKKIPITAAKRISQDYGYDQVVIIGRAVGEGEHVTSYGKSKAHCRIAGRMAKFIKTQMGWYDADARGEVIAELSSIVDKITELSGIVGKNNMTPEKATLIRAIKLLDK